MALATRCPNCQVLFRVVADQLKLRGGLVRCGACRHVFDAIGSLTYIEDNAGAVPEPRAPVRKAAPPTLHITAGAAAVLRALPDQPKARHRAPGRPGDAPGPDFSGPPTLMAHEERAEVAPRESSARAPRRVEPRLDRGAEAKAETRADSKIEPRGEAKVEPRSEARAETRAESRNDARSDVRADASGLRGAETEGRVEPVAGPEVSHPPSPRRKRRHEVEDTAHRDAKSSPGTTSAEAALEDESPQPEFLRAEREGISRGFSVFYGGGSAVLAVLLLLQLAIVFRTDLTTRWPQWRPALVQICGVFGCNVGWPTRAELLAVVGTELQAVPGTDVLELTAVIRNRASFKVALPAIEVTLTDTTNRTLARKVFVPVDYLASAGEQSSRIDEGLGAGSDYTIRVAFEARGVTAVGFVVYPFYL